jgi:hypothetical protein
MSQPSLVLPRVFSVLLGLLAAGTLAAQVLSAGPKTTTLETALFSVLQFVFSLGFAWILTRIAAKNEFVESQKGFAIAAYRRINEIDEGVARLIARATAQSRSGTPDVRRELDVVMAIAVGVKTSIRSSIADWGDVIGDEIATINRIEEIKGEQVALLELPQQATPDSPNEDDARAETRALHEQLERNNEQVAQLLKTLPPSLRVVAEDSKRARDLVATHADRLRAEYKRTGTLTLRGFWEAGLRRDVQTMSIGDRLTIRIGSTVGERMLAVCAYDNEGQEVGIIVNNGAGPYYVFRESLVRFLGSVEVPVELVSLEQRPDTERHYFVVTVLREAIEAGRQAERLARATSDAEVLKDQLGRKNGEKGDHTSEA